MSDFIQKILIEANLENDYAAYQKAGEFVKKAKELISQFPNKFVSYNPKEDFAQVKIGSMMIQLFGQNNSLSKRYAGQMNAAYEARKNILNLFGTEIEYNKIKNKLDIQFDEKEAVHELTHFLDLKRSSGKQQKDYLKKLSPQFTKEYLEWTKKNNLDPDNPIVFSTWESRTGKSVQVQRDFKEYVNDPYETNAHFMEHIMPQINNYVSKTLELPSSFQEFKNGVFQNALNDRNFKAYYGSLAEDNKKKFLKRIATYYQELKNFVAKDQHIDFSKENTELEIHKPILNKFFQKIKSILGSEQKNAA